MRAFLVERDDAAAFVSPTVKAAQRAAEASMRSKAAEIFAAGAGSGREGRQEYMFFITLFRSASSRIRRLEVSLSKVVNNRYKSLRSLCRPSLARSLAPGTQCVR